MLSTRDHLCTLFTKQLNAKKFIFIQITLFKLILSSCLLVYANQSWSDEEFNIDASLEKADHIKSSDNQMFVSILTDIRSHTDQLSQEQKYYLDYLSGYQNAFNGNIKEAISLYRHVEKNTANIELQFKVSLSLVNLYALTKDWLNGFNYLNNISKLNQKISDAGVRHQGLIIAAFFYNELELYDMTNTFVDQLVSENLSDRNKCLVYSVKLKADLSTLHFAQLEKDIFDAIESCKLANELVIINILRSYLASYYLSQKQPQKVISLLSKHLNEINRSGYQLLKVETNGLLAQAYFEIKNLKKAKEYALIVVSNKSASEYMKVIVSAYQILSMIAKEDNNYHLAFDYQNQYIQSKESLFEQTKAKQLAIESAKYSIAEKDNQIALLNKQTKIAQLKLNNQKQMQIVWSVVFISIAILVFFLYYRRTAQKELLRQKEVNNELKELDKLKDRILTNTSHELRTPLNGIIGLSELLLIDYENKVDDELIKSIQLIKKSGVQLSVIVNDILDLAQLKSQRMPFRYQEFNISTLISEVLTLCKPMLQDKQVTLEFDEEACKIDVTQEKQRIQQVLFNLISNAIKFTPEGKIHVYCTQQPNILWCHVQDSGIGIPEAKIKRVTQGFEQVDSGNNRVYEGSGIGLAICQEIASALGGELLMQSKPGKGTLVSFGFPILHL